MKAKLHTLLKAALAAACLLVSSHGFSAPLVQLDKIGALTGLTGAEISAFDPASNRLFITSGSGLVVVDLSDPTMPVVGTPIDPANDSATSSAVTSVAVSGGIVAAGVPGSDEQIPGRVFFYNAADSNFLGSVEVGPLPDMVTFTPDGQKVLVANEGEPGDYPVAGSFYLEITEIWSGQDGDDLTEDWFEITNRGDTAWVSGNDPDLFYDDDSANPNDAGQITGIVQIDPGESSIVVIGNGSDATDFFNVWDPDKSLTGIDIGSVDGSGLSGDGDGVTLWVGDPTTTGEFEDFAFYPMATSGVSFDTNLRAESVSGANGAVTTTAVNTDNSEPAIGSPGSANAGFEDPDGSVSIIDISGGVGSATVEHVTFESFLGQEATLSNNGVRLFPFRSITEDLEPEYITVTPDGNTAFVALQENNTLAKINLTTLAVELLPLGTKDHSQPGNEIDASDDDGDTFNLQNYPVMGLFMPDAIASFSSGGTDYVITANEGDARDEDEDIRNVTLDPTAFPDAATLQLTPNAGNLEISTIEGDTDGDTDFDELFTYGARSFSIFDSDGNLVFDSGSALAQIANGAGIYPDDRSDNKGTEPEGVTTGVVGTRNFAFVGLERASAILAYDITTPASPAFQQIVFDQPNDISPEGLTFVSAAESPSGVPLLIVTNEVSNTLAVYSVAIPNQPDITFNQKGRGGPIVGEDLYTASGAGQSLRLRAKKRSVFKFNVGNDGSATATYAVRGFKLPRKRFKLRFLQTSPARSNVTASVRTGREAETIGAGATASYQAIISKTTSRPARISEKVSATGGALTDLMTYRASFR